MIDDKNENETVYSQLHSYNRSLLRSPAAVDFDINFSEFDPKEEVCTSSKRSTLNMATNRNLLRNRNILVDLLAIFFGIGTWVGINGIFIQLPLLIAVAPEGPNLPSYLNIIVQLGNLGPFMYALAQKFLGNKKNDVCLIYGLLAVGTSSSLLLSFFYNKSAILFGTNLSGALYVLTFFTALNGCTSAVLFMPYMGRFKEMYLTTFFVGEGLSGLLPSVVALFQGIGGSPECVLNITSGEYIKHTTPPKFSSTSYFLFIFIMMLCSCISFLLLEKLKLVKAEYAPIQTMKGNTYTYGKNTEETPTGDATDDPTPKISNQQYKYLLLLIGIVSFFSNGTFNSIESFSCLPYGSNAYHLAVTLGAVANPVACFLAVFLPHKSLRSILTLSVISVCLTIYVFLTAIMGAEAPLHGSSIGTIIVIAAWTLLIGTVSYLKLCITTIMRAQGGKSLIWTGSFTQLGATIGSVLIFFLINFVHIFPQISFVEEC